MFISTLSKKIGSKSAILKKFATRTPVSTKRTNRVGSKNHTSGAHKIFFLSDLISMGLRGNILKNQKKIRKKISQYLLGLRSSRLQEIFCRSLPAAPVPDLTRDGRWSTYDVYVPESYIMYLSDFCRLLLFTYGWERRG